MLTQALLNGAGKEILRPAEVFGRPAALPGLDHKDQRASRLQSRFNIINGLGALVERNVLGKAAAACNDNIRLPGHIHLVNAVNRPAGLLPGGEIVAGKNGSQAHLCVHDKIDHKQVFHQTGGFAHILVQGIALQNAIAHGGVRAQGCGIQGKGMVVKDGLPAADTGQDALASAAEAGHHMMCCRAEADDHIRQGRSAIDGDRRAVGRCAEVDKILRFAVVVFHGDPVVNGVRHQGAQLRLVAAGMRAVGDHDGDVPLAHAAALGEIVHQMRHHQILPHPEARHIADHQRNGAARGDPPAQRCAVNGGIQRGPQLLAYVGNRLHHIAVQLSDDVFLLQRELHCAAAVCKSIGFHSLHLPIL